MSDVISWANSIIWSPALVYLCLAVGVFFTIRTRLVQVRQLPEMFRQTFRGTRSADGVSSFQALAMSLSGRVGTGNIAGVATAIAFGGPGAVFWMWTVAFLGASTSFIESTLGQVYKERDRDTGEYRGGPAYYLAKAFRHTRARGLFNVYASVFAFVSVLALALFMPGVQANGMAAAIDHAWGVEPWVTGVGIVIVLGFIILGGVKRIANFTSIVVPFMAIVYILLAIVIVFVNAHMIGDVLSLIFSSAFGLNATFGAIVGSAVEWGVKRGIYSNEAGQGTGPHAAAAAEVSHPAKQGLVQAGAVYIDTLFVCSATAFMILSTGMYRVFANGAEDGPVLHEGAGGLSKTVAVGPGFAQAGFDTLMPGLGATFIAVSLAFFAFTTIVAYYYMAETNLKFLLAKVPDAGARSVVLRIMQAALLVACVFGATTTATDAWALGDIGVGLMAWLNIVAVLILQRPALAALRDFERQRKSGLDPQFDPTLLGIRGASYWEERLVRT
ncbi:sodium:alanine symporter family protein [Microbacterium sp. G2-8]|uniref:alanine/glycine:cation symporter family protein n=1 Tax=Microbacterium sp. G2-8 TaxID=2842454 RepID=UPI001C890B17|nr:alanine/glycine:cation symporter family protein [Microbacterium sp. G2-8]